METPRKVYVLYDPQGAPVLVGLVQGDVRTLKKHHGPGYRVESYVKRAAVVAKKAKAGRV
jgi:putative component of toxin-antitoxin plasmid stabilization module